jgi:tetratricopeptide (TPR) repeat protein
MRVRIKTVWVGGCAVIAALTLTACGQIATLQARKAFKDANALYQQQDYKRAADKYEEVVQVVQSEAEPDPNLIAAYFYLGNSYDQLYRPSRKGEPTNDELLTKAINNYKLAVEREQSPQRKKLAMQYLVASFGADKLNDPAQAEPVLLKMIEVEPSDPANYFVLARIYEDAGSYDQAEGTLVKAREAKPEDPTVYMQLASYYNRQGEFDKTIEALQQRAQREPNNPEAHYTIASYYWDEAFRDFRLKEDQKRSYVDRGLNEVNQAIKIKPDYIEAITYKGLLLRLQANMEKSPDRQKALLKEAEDLQAQAKELQKKKAAGVS